MKHWQINITTVASRRERIHVQTGELVGQ